MPKKTRTTSLYVLLGHCWLYNNMSRSKGELVIIMVSWCLWWPSLVKGEVIHKKCDRCHIKTGIECFVTEVPYPCFLPDKNHKYFPHKPRNVTMTEHLDNEATWHIHLSWKLPYDYSYSVVTGFQLTIDTLTPMSMFKVWPMRCFHFNLSHIDWSTIDDVHSLQFYFDCLQYNVSMYSRDVVVTMFSLPKASINSDFVTVQKTLPAKMPADIWQPRIRVTPNTTGLFVKFYPPFKNADHHKICAMDVERRICTGGYFRSNKNTDVTMIDIPRNRSYCIMVRPYNANDESLDDWVETSKQFFYPDLPVTDSKLNGLVTGDPRTNAPTTDNYIIIIIVIVLLLIFLLLFVLGIRKCKFRYHKLEFIRNIFRKYREGVPTQELENKKVTITPIFIPTNDQLQLVQHHLTLLKKSRDKYTVSIYPTPFTSSNNMFTVRGSVDRWIGEQLNIYENDHNHHIIIYVSPTLIKYLSDEDTPYEDPSHQSCIQMITKLEQVIDKTGKKPFVACFGNRINVNNIPLFSKFKEMTLVRSHVSSRNGVLDDLGTVELLNQMFLNENNRSFSLDPETIDTLLFTGDRETSGYESRQVFHHPTSSHHGADIASLHCNNDADDINAAMVLLNNRCESDWNPNHPS